MTEEITLERVCNKLSWGFRLTGGRDFGSPLTVSRIHAGSISEKGGLQVGDIITQIGSEKASQLTHADAQRTIIESGDTLKLSVLRGSCPDVQRVLTPVRVVVPPELTFRPFQHKKAFSIASSVYSLYEDDSFELLDQSDDEFLDEYREPTEKEIDEMLLENAEALEENGRTVLGVNFHRFIPKCDFIKDSAVFAALQEEQVHKELSEREQLAKCPTKRFSTFLAPPDRPVPTPKRSPEKQEVKTEENVKSGQGGSTDTSNNSTSTVCCQHDISTCAQNECPQKIVSRPSTPISRSESPSFSKDPENDEPENTLNEEKKDESIHCENDRSEAEKENHADGQVCMQEVPENDEDDDDTGSKTNSEKSVEFETQLKNIKNTLNTLGELPLMIQSQLQNIQNQINNLLKLKSEQDKISSSDKRKSEVTPENHDMDDEAQPVIEEYDDEEISVEDEEISESYSDYEELNEENEMNDTTTINEAGKYTKEGKERTDGTSVNREKSIDDDLELRKRRICPLTPLPRPVVLPGGRIWRKPQDAYNEEFIAETLISQAEVLVGSTLGVNFRKYEPPKFDVSNSAVYKMIHNIESKKTGLENRDTVPALQDYYQSPIKAKHFYLAKLAEQAYSPKENNGEEESQVT